MKTARIVSTWMLALLALTGVVATHGQEAPIGHDLNYEAFRWCEVPLPVKAATSGIENDVVDRMLREELGFLRQELELVRGTLEESHPQAFEYQHMYSINLADLAPGTLYNLALSEDLAAMRQLTKVAYLDEEETQQDLRNSFLLTVHADGVTPKSFARSDNKVTLNFHENGTLSTLGVVTDGVYYWYKWNEDGELIKSRESRID